MIHTLPWNDLSLVHQRAILRAMTESFKKPWTDAIQQRFLRPSCRITWYEEGGIWRGICIHWKEADFHYLDKFFILPGQQRKGTGRAFLEEWIQYVQQEDSSIPWIWRTDAVLATAFYGKHPLVQTHAVVGTYVYQGIPGQGYPTTAMTTTTTHRHSLAEDILPLLSLPSAFEIIPSAFTVS
jgi:GNAT superfamily N-acetyltransferase